MGDPIVLEFEIHNAGLDPICVAPTFTPAHSGLRLYFESENGLVTASDTLAAESSPVFANFVTLFHDSMIGLTVESEPTMGSSIFYPNGHSLGRLEAYASITFLAAPINGYCGETRLDSLKRVKLTSRKEVLCLTTPNPVTVERWLGALGEEKASAETEAEQADALIFLQQVCVPRAVAAIQTFQEMRQGSSFAPLIDQALDHQARCAAK